MKDVIHPADLGNDKRRRVAVGDLDHCAHHIVVRSGPRVASNVCEAGQQFSAGVPVQSDTRAPSPGLAHHVKQGLTAETVRLDVYAVPLAVRAGDHCRKVDRGDRGEHGAEGNAAFGMQRLEVGHLVLPQPPRKLAERIRREERDLGDPGQVCSNLWDRRARCLLGGT